MIERTEASGNPQIHRVLMTGDTVGGVWTFTLDLAEALAAHDAEVLLASFGGVPTDAQLEQARAIKNLCLVSSPLKLEWMEEPWDEVAESGRLLMELAAEFSPDVVHLNTFGHGALPWRVPTLLTAHSCVLSWWEAVKGEAAPETWRRYKQEVRRSLHAVDAIAAPSQAMAAALTKHYGIAADACRVIPNGTRVERFTAASKEPMVLAAGRVWDEAKNVAAVAKVARSLAWPVYVAGDARNHAFEGCRMLGRLTSRELAGWQARAAIYALPARYEPFGLSILEAALSGCALVLGDIPSLRSIWGDAALFVRPDDENALRGTLQHLIDDSNLRDRMAQKAYARAMPFTAARMAQGYVDGYHQALAMRSRPCVS